MTPINVNPAPNASPEDKETLRKVYKAQLDEYEKERKEAAQAAQAAEEALGAAEDEYWAATRREAALQGKADALRALAARDGITDL